MPITRHGDCWIVESGNAAYALGPDADGILLNTYWGQRLPRHSDYPQPADSAVPIRLYSLRGGQREVVTGEGIAAYERTLDVIASGGVRGFVLRFAAAEIEGETLVITLRDELLAASIVLRITALGDRGLLSRSLTMRNEGKQELKLTRAFSGSLPLPAGEDFALNHLEGQWGDEFRLRREPFAHGSVQRQSRALRSGLEGPPFFAIDRDSDNRQAGEEHGEVWFGTLRWSGNWRLIAERLPSGENAVHLGINDFDFAYDLGPGESFTTPELVYGHTAGGFGSMSRALHDYIREEVSPRPDFRPPVVYNSWFATLFDINEAGQLALADKAAALGVEMFIMDDGWFGERNNEKAGLGDWKPNPTKFPRGLKPLVEAVHARGMQFGLWVEPEMVNPDSDLYRAHPEWTFHFAGRTPTTWRSQLILNFGRMDVQDHIIGALDAVMRSAPIDLMKWDMNRSASEPGWPGYERDQREIWVRHVEGLYRVWRELRRRHPDVMWENCSAGGGRSDLGTMALTEQNWVSDTVLPPARLEIQEGYTRLFPASTMACWVTDDAIRSTSLDFAFHVSMTGSLGIGGDLMTWDNAQLGRAAEHVATYKALRDTITRGDLYRLRSPNEHAVSAMLYVEKDKSSAVLFLFRTHASRIGMNPIIHLEGLDPESDYEVERVEGRRSGAAWRELGLKLPLKDFESAVLRVTRR